MPSACRGAVQPTFGESDVAGFCQLLPPSVLRQMPPPLTVPLSSSAVATITLALSGKYRTSPIAFGVNEETNDQLSPPSVVLKRPPESVATNAIWLLVGCTVTA